MKDVDIQLGLRLTASILTGIGGLFLARAYGIGFMIFGAAIICGFWSIDNYFDQREGLVPGTPGRGMDLRGLWDREIAPAVWRNFWKFGLYFALAVGLILTVPAMMLDWGSEAVRNFLLQGGEGFLKVFEHWAPHFGPELLILAFAAKWVDEAIQRGERRDGVRWRTVRDLYSLVYYVEEKGRQFGHPAVVHHLRDEREALEIRRETRRLAFRHDERKAVDEALNACFAFIDAVLNPNSTAADVQNKFQSFKRHQLKLRSLVWSHTDPDEW